MVYSWECPLYMTGKKCISCTALLPSFSSPIPYSSLHCLSIFHFVASGFELLDLWVQSCNSEFHLWFNLNITFTLRWTTWETPGQRSKATVRRKSCGAVFSSSGKLCKFSFFRQNWSSAVASCLTRTFLKNWWILTVQLAWRGQNPKHAGSGIMIKQAANPQQLQPFLCWSS